MDLMHFTHNHALVFHQVPQGSEIHCSGCKSLGSGNVYACWSCNHFLHEQCYHAKRSLNHPSHTLHPLTLVPYPTYQSGSFSCNSCNLGGNGMCYTCSECQFDLHVHCALLPNPNPQVSSFPIPNHANNYINPQTPIYSPQNHNYPPTQNNVHPCFPQNVPTNGSNNQNNHFPSPYIQSNTPQQNYNAPVNSPYPNPPPHHITATGGSNNQNSQFQFPYQQPNTLPPNPTVNTPYSNTPPQPMPTFPTYSTVVTSTATNNPPRCYPAAEPHQHNPPSAIKHFSHPHTLKQTELHQSSGKICSACDCKLSGSSVVCTEPHCTFNLHKACFDSPHEIRHKSHPSHPLRLTTSSTYNQFTCNACHKEREAFTYTCTTCSYNIHIDCASLPEKKSRRDHKHALTLYYSSPMGKGSTFYCDGCSETVHESAWMYCCRGCDFGFHVECVDSEIKPQSVISSVSSDMDKVYAAAIKARISAYSNQACLNLI